MPRFSYHERDYSFGQAMLSLRTAIGLTQAGLANYLAVSRQAIGDWEAGASYPKPEHLKQLIGLAAQHQAFHTGQEAEEIRAFWRAARQKVLLDETWLAGLLNGDQPVPAPTQPTLAAAPDTPPPPAVPRLDWGDALVVPTFFGRERELATLTQWIQHERCRVASVLGMGGIGKSGLVVQAMRQLAEHFQVVIFRSLRNSPSCEVLLDDLLQVLSPQPHGPALANLEERLNQLLKFLRDERIFLVVDNVEALLEAGDARGRLRAGYEGYARLLREVAESAHQSCLLLTSRERPADLRLLEGRGTPVRSLRLEGLDTSACARLFEAAGVVGSPREQARLVDRYGGNPLALKIVTETVIDLFGGDIGRFVAQETLVFGGIADVIEEQVKRLSPVEQTLVCWLAIAREPITLEALRGMLVTPASPAQMLEAIDGLRRRSLVERGLQTGTFTLHPVLLEYVTATIVAEAVQEIQQGALVRLIEHRLCQADAPEYVRQTQERLLVAPILAQLQGTSSGQLDIQARLCALLDPLRGRAEAAQGYGPTNLLTLLRVLQGHLRGLDLSHLLIRGANLQGIEMQDTNLAQATLRDTSFTGTFSFITTIATSPDGRYWAAANQLGELRIWLAGGQTLYRAWQAHTARDYTITFHPDGRTLVTGGWDGDLKAWDVEQGTLLWTGLHPAAVQRVVFSPDGRTLASAGNDETIRFWDAQQGTLLRTLSTPGGPIFALAWHPGGRLLASAGSDHQIRLWDLQAEQPGENVRLLAGHTNWVIKLTFAPDGHILASTGFDQLVKLWDVDNLRLRAALAGHTGLVLGLAWCPDGNLLASCGDDQTIRLWDVEKASPRAVLHGHHGSVMDIAFTSDGRYLVSGGLDNTLRVWETERGQCMRILQGYTASLNDLAWSPDGARLASIGADTLVTIWDVAEKRRLTVFDGLSWVLNGMAWSPDSRLLAISGWVNAIRIWDATTGTCLRTLRDPDHDDTPLHGIGWSPDGKYLAAGSTGRGMQVWEAATGARVWVNPAQLTGSLHVIWSPDGRRLASCGTENNVYLWDAANGTLLATLQGHRGLVKYIAWSPDGARLASCGGTGSGELLVWDANNGACLLNWSELGAVMNAVAWHPSGTILVCGSNDGQLHWRSAESGEELRVQQGYPGPVQIMKPSPHGQILASCGDDGAIDLWEFESGEKLQTLHRDRPYERLNISQVRGLTAAQKAAMLALGAIESS